MQSPPPSIQTCDPELRPIPGMGLYLAGSDGAVYSMARRWRSGKPRRIASWEDEDGYLHVRVNRVHCTVHALIARAFLGPKPEGQEVRHLDGNPANNRPTNLRWGTQAENAADREIHGTVARGSRHGNAILTEAQVRGVKRRLARGHRHKDIAADLGVSTGAIDQISTGRNWRHARSSVH